MRAHLISNGIVTNTIEVDSLDVIPGLIEATGGGIGWTYEDGVLSPPVQPEKTPEEIYKELESAVDSHVDAVAKTKGYDSRITVTMRAGYENPWQAEGIAFGQWMDSCYLYCQQAQADILAELRPIPTKTELIAELPEMVWPE